MQRLDPNRVLFLALWSFLGAVSAPCYASEATLIAVVTVDRLTIEVRHIDDNKTMDELAPLCGPVKYGLNIKEVLGGKWLTDRVVARASVGEWCDGPIAIAELANEFLIEIALHGSQWWIVKVEQFIPDGEGGKFILPRDRETVSSLNTDILMSALARPLNCGRVSDFPEGVLRQLIRRGVVSLDVDNPEVGDIGDVYCIKGLRLNSIRGALNKD